MAKEEYRCEECGKIFRSTETLEKHSRVEHGFSARYIQMKEFELPSVSVNRDLLAGVFIGVLLTALLFTGYSQVQSMQKNQPVDITVVTCSNCSYSGFRDTADSLFNVKYHEVDYSSERGQELVDKYSLYYVPGFIFDKEVRNRENFTQIKSTVVEFEDAYVLPDRGVKAAQRVSQGITLDQHR